MHIADAIACVDAVVTAMKAKGCGVILFSTYAGSGESAVRALVQRLAAESEAFGIRIGMVTIDGVLPAPGPNLAALADVYWDLFLSPDRRYEREVRFRASGPNVRNRSL